MKGSSITSICLWLLSASLSTACAHDHDDAKVWSKEELEELERKWGFEWSFTGIGSFAHLKYTKCLTTPSELYDIAIIGVPFDTAVSYRPGARFGPRAIRQASARQTSFRGSSMRRPKLMTLGGDHSLALPALRALREIYGQPIRVLHFDAHLDTWHPSKYPSAWAPTPFNHGSMFWLAGTEGLLSNATTGPSVHAGLRTRLSGTDASDHDDDTAQNWVRISADEMDDFGTAGVITRIMETLGTEDPVYLSVDIDVLDPAFAPGTGTPEPGGWTTRELIRVLRGVEGLNVVGADVVEVSPAYQGSWGRDGARGGAGRLRGPELHGQEGTWRDGSRERGAGGCDSGRSQG
ncbi:agmatinase [Verticillium alfalfae VaMs.102]|uniref:Agmatinase n=1 Tax=Verticillium alfalfae (strain VaMs.102 / ATCC MYA-4576 / FGSC 10136) TaxID=526221 RepID=C9SUX6_VERA1|nr:agmatinase [Verticillium alfalfae VaMs.102]EEY22591.1 agmatinase [Verticillium alfalfae VaMs.102]